MLDASQQIKPAEQRHEQPVCFYPFGRDFHFGYSGNSISHDNPTAASSDKIPIVRSSAFRKVPIRTPILEDNDHAGKRRRGRAVAEAQAPAYKPDFTGLVVDELVKIAGVGPDGDKQYDRRSGFSGLAPAFEYPIINRPSVRRIAENRLFGPVLLQSRCPPWCRTFRTWHFRPRRTDRG